MNKLLIILAVLFLGCGENKNKLPTNDELLELNCDLSLKQVINLFDGKYNITVDKDTVIEYIGGIPTDIQYAFMNFKDGLDNNVTIVFREKRHYKHDPDSLPELYFSIKKVTINRWLEPQQTLFECK